MMHRERRVHSHSISSFVSGYFVVETCCDSAFFVATVISSLFSFRKGRLKFSESADGHHHETTAA